MLDDRGGFDRLGHDLLWLLPLWASSSFGARPRRCSMKTSARTGDSGLPMGAPSCCEKKLSWNLK
ncbi:hypothetical protein M514_17730 [Trichuris suis]|uniref:Uncharacterized protein n=1 Tax=Trichuris suis TaxID=68888 RepID=A0A085NKY2_9BILA|nr:hypothetical protein M514_17730 [Trichuris suis]